MKTMVSKICYLSLGLLLGVAPLIPASAQPMPLPPLEVNSEYMIGMPGGTELRCLILAPPQGQWVRCQSKTSQKELWVNLGAVLYITPRQQ